MPAKESHPHWPDWTICLQEAGTVTARVYLAPRDAAGLAALATRVSTPGTALYRHFLTPGQIQARYGATATQVNSVKTWLTQSGLHVTSISNHVADGYIAVTGSLAAAGRAFHVTFGSYRLAGQGVVRARSRLRPRRPAWPPRCCPSAA